MPEADLTLGAVVNRGLAVSCAVFATDAKFGKKFAHLRVTAALALATNPAS